jgi:excinuclease ABC subunit A
VFELIRLLFAQLPEAKLRGYTSRRFSFNVPGGRCEACEGNGQRCIEMHFLPDVWVPCETCRGRRYNLETLEVQFHGHSVADVLELTCAESLSLFGNLPKIRRILQTLCDVGLDYLTLGQSAPTLSGGEAQRVKLAAELSRPDTGRTLYLLDEPTTGLHFDDLAKLLTVLNRLVDLGNTVVVIEHNLDVIKTADWVIDLGPEAGEAGGHVTAVGTPEQIAQQPASLSGQALRPVLERGPYQAREIYQPTLHHQTIAGDLDITDVGKQAKMPWEIDGPRWHTCDRVGRKGEPCRWEGRVLSEVVKRIHELGKFGETNWNARSVVEIPGTTKSHGWFMHAITGETWLLKLKFRTSKGSFRREEVVQRFNLKTLNEMHELPIYGNEPRVRCKSVRGPWQEVEFRIHSWEEIDTPEFWEFLQQAVEGFQRTTQHVAANPEDLMPWKKLGRKWHLSRRGFPLGKKVVWEPQLLEDLCDLLGDIAGSGAEFLWSNQQLVHLCVAGQRQPWATLVTKRPEAIELALNGPKSLFGLGRITSLGHRPSLDGQHDDCDIMRIHFRNHDDLDRGRLREFLEEHLEGVRGALTDK